MKRQKHQTPRCKNGFKTPLYVILFIISTLLSAPLFATEQPPNQPNTLLILDGSGSMWGKIKDGHKVTIARQALAISLAAYNKKLNLGLMAYGHRRRAACNDIELLKKPGPLNSGQLSNLIKKVKPVGKTPITHALETAIPLVKEKNQTGHIILLTDGPENCRRDPCTLIKKTTTNNIAIHVIAFAMKPADAKSLQCLAQQSGGQFLTPNNKQQLITALKTALNASTTNKRLPASANLNDNKMATPGLKLTAHLGPTTKALQHKLSWAIAPIKNNQPAPKPSFKSQDPTPFFPLTAGQYHITAQFKDHQIQKQLTLKKEEHRVEKIIFNLSEVQLPAAWAPANSRSGFGKVVLKSQKNDKLTHQITLTNTPQTKLLPAGPYKVTAIDNGHLRNWSINAEAGKTTTLPIWKSTGRLQINLTDATTGAPLNRPVLRLTKQETGGGKKEIKLSAAQTPQFDLEAGTYLISLKEGYAQKTHKTEITNNKTTTLTLSLKRAHLTVKTTDAQNTKKPAIIIHQQTNKKFNHLTTTSDLKKPIILAPGSYRVTLTTGQEQNNLKKTITLKAGDKKELSFIPQNTPVQLRITTRKDPLSRHQTFWQVFTKKGELIWQSTQAEPNLNLTPGHYHIKAEIGRDQYSKKVRISGQNRTTIDLAKHKIKK